MFNKIDIDKWERAEHFKYYINLIKTNYTVTVDFDITKLCNEIEKRNLKFFPTMLYAIIKGVNLNKEFRMSYDKDGNLGYWDYCDPSYTIFHEDDHTFSDIWSKYNEDFKIFYKNVAEDMQKYRNIKGIKTKLGRGDNFCPISCVPWVHYKSVSHDTYTEPGIFFPVITFGKYEKKEDKVVIPFSIFVSHAVADGWHTAKLINDVQNIIDNCSSWM
ncbi:chloramphenicol acetyltransferase [Fusobacterium sp.]|uniref:chloramphenicol acetyltransferase n=1 Tax=Fusobacterium sp. TaxID=68766 RepID=UPI000C6FDBFF|nr:chloramphenicol acetyltransferase [Fusobacterium sp.]